MHLIQVTQIFVGATNIIINFAILQIGEHIQFFSQFEIVFDKQIQVFLQAGTAVPFMVYFRTPGIPHPDHFSKVIPIVNGITFPIC